jgi:glucosamine-phosphate N-acetyltransferase
MQLGKKVIEFLADHAYSMGCYKVILDCSLDNKALYEKCGFKQKEVQMVKFHLRNTILSSFLSIYVDLLFHKENKKTYPLPCHAASRLEIK